MACAGATLMQDASHLMQANLFVIFSIICKKNIVSNALFNTYTRKIVSSLKNSAVGLFVVSDHL